MSDGGEESKGESEYDGWRSTRSNPDDYGRAVSKMAVAQICEGVGFESFTQSAMEALSDITIRYIRDLGKSASFYANLAGRSECNVFDIVKGLEDLGSTCGFSSSSEVNDCVARSGIVKEMSDFVGRVEEMEIPFAQPIPHFPVIKYPRRIPSFSQMGESPSSKHIPDWLPAFPDPHTYSHSPVWNNRKTGPQVGKAEQAKQRRKAEKSLLRLQQRLLSHSLAEPSGSGHSRVGDGKDTGVSMEDNQVLAPPLPHGKKDASTVSLPDKPANEGGDRKHVSVRETFAPAIDALKGDGVSDMMDFDRRVVSNRMPVVHFKFKGGKKMLVEDLDVHLRNQASEKRARAPLFGRDDEKDDKKRKAELILRQSMENQQEVSQM